MSISARAALLEGWVAVQSAAAELALEGAEKIPGIRLEPEFVQALASLRTRRVEVYGEKPLLFEETERLAWAIQTYVATLRQPHDRRQRLAKAMACMSESRNLADPGTEDNVLRAQQELVLARKGVSRSVRAAYDHQLDKARRQMMEARELMERNFYITRTGPIEPDPFGPFPGEGGGQRQSESNKRELKPRAPMRPGH